VSVVCRQVEFFVTGDHSSRRDLSSLASLSAIEEPQRGGIRPSTLSSDAKKKVNKKMRVQ
jgi:hypothetical protein